MPAILDEHALIDDVRAGAHRGQRSLRVPSPVAVAWRGVDLDNAAAFVAEPLQPRSLVFQPFRGQELRVGVAHPSRDPRVARELELHQVLALEEVIQVTRREDELTRYVLHASMLFAVVCR